VSDKSGYQTLLAGRAVAHLGSAGLLVQLAAHRIVERERPGRVRLTGATRVLPQKVNHSRQSYPPDSTDADSDPADATRGYPPDSTDDSNSLNQIAF